jgi:hypothetical protein
MENQISVYPEDQINDGLLNKVKRIATSFASFICAFIISKLLLQMLIASISRLLKYKVKFSYNELVLTQVDYHYWSRANIVVTYFIPSVICFFIGLSILNLLRIYSKWAGSLRIFFFWMAVILINMVLTRILTLPLASPHNLSNGLYQTFAVVAAWYFINPAINTMAAIASLFASLGFGLLVRDEVMRYSFSKKLIRTKGGMDSMVIQVYLVPVLISATPLVLLTTHMSFLMTIFEFANLMVILIGIFLVNSIRIPKVRCNKEDVLNRFPIVGLAFAAIMWWAVFLFIRSC